ALEVPFRNQDGIATTQTINATDIHPADGGVVATFALTDEWARLAYGALGTQGFQAHTARLEVAYIFPAYVPVRAQETRVLWGGKAASLDEAAMRKPLLTAAASSLHQPIVANSALLAQPALVAHHPVLTPPLVFVRPKTYGIRTQGRSSALDV